MININLVDTDSTMSNYDKFIPYGITDTGNKKILKAIETMRNQQVRNEIRSDIKRGFFCSTKPIFELFKKAFLKTHNFHFFYKIEYLDVRIDFNPQTDICYIME